MARRRKKKIIRFPLLMENGAEVRTMQELKDNFSLLSMRDYLEDGKLVAWLRDRYYKDLAGQVAALDKNDEHWAEKLCQIFEMTYDNQAMKDDVEKAEERSRKRGLLATFPADQEYEDKIDFVAFKQEDVDTLLDQGAKEIYLCGKEFSLPSSIENVKFIGIIEGVVVCFKAQEPIDLSAKGIEFEHCALRL